MKSVYNNRYHLEERIGDGGTAIVWRGMDALLRRRVAIKVLRPQFVGDAEFVRRFYHEAESAARLSHPHIVGIYDVGREDEEYYLVMELIDGSSLAQRIADEAPFSERQVLDTALQMCGGLAYAHRQGILHRDIKPANILLTRDGIVKISDFGIARAMTRQTVAITQQGRFLGSVAYLSPEQAQGHELTPSSDLYSVGVILYEMLAGHPPFSGESPIALALKHLSDPVPPLPSSISPQLAAVVMRLLAKTPIERYESAEALAGALRAARDAMPIEPLPSSSPPPPPPPPPARPSPLPDRVVVVEPDLEMPLRPLWRKKRFAVAMLLLLLVGVALGFVATESPFVFHPSRPVTMPDLGGASLADAERRLHDLGLPVQLLTSASESVAPDHVIDQVPLALAEVAAGSTVTLRISSGLPLEEVPDLTAFSVDDARRLLNERGLSLRTLERFDPQIPKASVIAQQPAPRAMLREHGVVTVTVSNGPAPIAVPTLIAMSVSAARQEAAKLGIKVVVGDQTSSDAIPAGMITAQDPAPSTQISPGSIITVVVSSGAAMATLPDVTGTHLDEGIASVQGAGFVPQVTYSVQSDNAGSIIGQNPGGGSQERRGGQVTLVVAVTGTVPDVSGMSFDEARIALQNAGYVAGTPPDGINGQVQIDRSDPAAGTTLRPGETVTLIPMTANPDTVATPAR